MQLVDTHCHIHEPEFPLPIADVMVSAAAAGVNQLICVGTNAQTSQQAVDFAGNHSNCWATVGLHPHDAKDHGELKKLAALLENDPKSRKIVAIGECGLDFFYNNSPKKDQEKALRFQIELALQYDLPLSFHVRDAFDDFWPIFDSYTGVKGVLHSFTDNQANLDQALGRDLFIGVNGIVTFTKNQWQLDVAKAIPLNKMVLETDAPFLTPVPHRGNVNLPAYVRVVLQFLSDLRREPMAEIANATTTNAQLLFTL